MVKTLPFFLGVQGLCYTKTNSFYLKEGCTGTYLSKAIVLRELTLTTEIE
jgi:hypothetical protein